MYCGRLLKIYADLSAKEVCLRRSIFMFQLPVFRRRPFCKRSLLEAGCGRRTIFRRKFADLSAKEVCLRRFTRRYSRAGNRADLSAKEVCLRRVIPAVPHVPVTGRPFCKRSLLEAGEYDRNRQGGFDADLSAKEVCLRRIFKDRFSKKRFMQTCLCQAEYADMRNDGKITGKN